MIEGSPIWQGGLLLFAVLFLLFEIWRGWRAGFARAGINVAAVVISTVVGLFAGQMAAAPFGGIKDPGGFISALTVGGGLGLFVFLVLWLSGIIFFKRTDHQSSGVFRLFWGAGGAFFGFVMGLFILWGGISVIRAIGALAEARVENAMAAEPPPAPEPATAQGNKPHSPSANLPEATSKPTPPPLAAKILKLKESLELGPAGKFVKSVDVIPTDYYDLIVEVTRLTSDQKAMLRFLEYPGVQEVMQSPKVVALFSDPEILKSAEQKNIAAMISNPKLIEAVQDPALAKELQKIDLRAAMKFALEPPASSPSPTTRPPGN